MKHWGLIFLILALGCILAAVAVKCWPRTLPPEQCSEVYRHYCNRSDLNVAFVKDYRIGDSITVDVTTITAKDSASWEALLREMNIDEKLIKQQRESIQNGTRCVQLYYCKEGHPDEPVSPKKCPDFNLVAESPRDKTVYVFDIRDIEQGRTIICEKISELIQTNLWNNQSK